MIQERNLIFHHCKPLCFFLYRPSWLWLNVFRASTKTTHWVASLPCDSLMSLVLICKPQGKQAAIQTPSRHSISIQADFGYGLANKSLSLAALQALSSQVLLIRHARLAAAKSLTGAVASWPGLTAARVVRRPILDLLVCFMRQGERMQCNATGTAKQKSLRASCTIHALELQLTNSSDSQAETQQILRLADASLITQEPWVDS